MQIEPDDLQTQLWRFAYCYPNREIKFDLEMSNTPFKASRCINHQRIEPQIYIFD